MKPTKIKQDKNVQNISCKNMKNSKLQNSR